jgi:hypothetical protein
MLTPFTTTDRKTVLLNRNALRHAIWMDRVENFTRTVSLETIQFMSNKGQAQTKDKILGRHFVSKQFIDMNIDSEWGDGVFGDGPREAEMLTPMDAHDEATQELRLSCVVYYPAEELDALLVRVKIAAENGDEYTKRDLVEMLMQTNGVEHVMVDQYQNHYFGPSQKFVQDYGVDGVQTFHWVASEA